MLDIGFSELVLIGGVALVVLGPEKLAVVARTSGKMAGKAQRYLNEVKVDLAREGELAELRQIKSQFEAARQELTNTFQQETQQLQTLKNEFKNEFKNDIQSGLVQDYAALSTPVPLAANLEPVATAMVATYVTDTVTDTATDAAPDYQAALDHNAAPVSTPTLEQFSQAMAWRSEIYAVQSDLTHLEQRLTQLKTALAESEAQLNLSAMPPV
jgi:sec-independent protein translocase protein TatB